MCKLKRDKREVSLNDKDLEYLCRLVRADVRYLSGRSARSRKGGDANATKAQKRRELADKLASLRREVR